MPVRRKITEAIREWDKSGRKTAFLLMGSRQVGKTYSVMEYGKNAYGDGFLHIDFSIDHESRKAFEGNLDVDSVIERLSVIHRGFRFVPGHTMLFFDEIQECPEARTSLKPFAIDGRFRVVASGSLLGIRMKEVSLNPIGYVERMELRPMDFEEFLWALDMPEAAIERIRKSISDMEPIDESVFKAVSDLFTRYVVVGGMPQAVKAYSETHVLTDLRRIHGEIFNQYLDDIRKYADKDVRLRTESCLRSLPSMLSSENKKFIYSRIEVPDGEERPRATGFRYYAPALDWLSMACTTLTCHNITEPKSPLEERIMPNSFKLYMSDTGLLLSRYDESVFKEVFFGNPAINAGAIAENAVAQAFTAQDRPLMYISKDDPRMEIDFVTVIGGEVCCIQVRSGNNRSTRTLCRVMRSWRTKGIVFETRNLFVDDKGIRHYPLFAASFMDAMDPRTTEIDDISGMREALECYGSDRSDR